MLKVYLMHVCILDQAANRHVDVPITRDVRRSANRLEHITDVTNSLYEHLVTNSI